MLHFNCYANDQLSGLEMHSNSQLVQGARLYGYMATALSAPTRNNANNWSFGKTEDNADEFITCDESESVDLEYANVVYEFLRSSENAGVVDTNRIFTSGFSQNSMFSM